MPGRGYTRAENPRLVALRCESGQQKGGSKCKERQCFGGGSKLMDSALLLCVLMMVLYYCGFLAFRLVKFVPDISVLWTLNLLEDVDEIF